MSSPKIPSTMRAQEFSSTKGGIEKTLHINASAPLPKRKPDQHLIQTIAAALNPVDYKPAEVPLVTALVLSKPVVPALDFVGRIVQPADGSTLKPGTIVFGKAERHFLGGALAEYTVSGEGSCATFPEGVDPIWGATVNIAGLTAYQSIVPYVKDGSNVFINGGSGGTGVFGIQIAKAKGCYVTTTCSTPNVDLCKSLGADEVIDYKTQNVLKVLQTGGRKYDHIVDNVGTSPELFWKAHTFTTNKAIFKAVGTELSLTMPFTVAAMKLWPGFLGGGRRKHEGIFAEPSASQLADIAGWMKNGQLKPVIDSKFKFEDAPQAFERMKTHRAKGKIVVEVNPQA